MRVQRGHLIVTLFVCVSLLCAGTASAEEIIVGSAYGNATITAALANASNGDLITVTDGTYIENVDVTKEVTIRSQNGSASTNVVASSDSDHVFYVTANNVNISGFNITGASDYQKAGIFLSTVTGCTITNNTAIGDNYGIYLSNSDSNTLTNNNASDTGNSGIYLYYSDINTLTNNNASDTGQSGIELSNSVSNTLTNNTASDSSYGIYLSYSASTTLTNNTATGAYYGICLSSSASNTLTNNNASDNSNHGIYLSSSDSNTLANNTANDNSNYGIYMSYSTGNTLTGNIISQNNYNLRVYSSSLTDYLHNIDTSNLVDSKPVYYLTSSSDDVIPANAGIVYAINCRNVSIQDLNIDNEYHGVVLAYTDNSTIENATISECYEGIYLSNSASNTLTNNNASDNSNHGIYLSYSDSNTLANNTASDNSNHGIYLSYSDSNTLANNTASNSTNGIKLYDSVSNTLTNNNASDNSGYGIQLASSDSNTLANNTASDNNYGIYMSYSTGNALTGNIISQNNYNLRVYSSSLTDYLHNIDTSNLVDSKPVYYLTNSSDDVIPANAGVVYAINCSNVSMQDLNIDNEYHGVVLAYTDNSTIENVTISDCNMGSYWYYSNNNTLTDSNISNNNDNGIYLNSYNCYNTLTGNTLSNNYAHGIYIRDHSIGNTLVNNTANNNGNYGLCLVYYAGDTTLTSNTANGNNRGISLYFSDSCTLTNNTANGNDDSGIRVDRTDSSTLTNNTASNNVYYGIDLWNSESNTLVDNQVSNNTNYDLHLYNSPNNIITPIILGDDLAELDFTSNSSTTHVLRTETNSNTFYGKTNINGYIEITSALSSMNVSLFYDDSAMSSTKEATLVLYKLNGTDWDEVNATINISSNTVAANLTEFGTFALFKDPEPATTTTSSSSGSSSGTRASVSQGQDPAIVGTSASSVIRVTGGADVNYDFSDSGTPVLGVSFESKDDQGLVVAKVQVLTGKPDDVPAPSGNSYQMMSIDVGSEGTISSGNADNIQIRFKVSKEWIEENNIDPASIRMTRYNGGQWNDMPSYQEREDDEYFYFYAETPGFSIFNIVGDGIGETPVETSEISTQVVEEETEVEDVETKDTPGFTVLAGIVLVSLAFLVSRKQKNE